MRLLVLSIALFVCSTSPFELIGRTQWAAASGRLTCEGEPAEGITVKLMESDNGILRGFFDRDDWMATTTSDVNGEFNMTGYTKEITNIEPYIAVFHDCRDGIRVCQRVLRVYIPKSYANSGDYAERIYDAGHLELAGRIRGEFRSCFN